LIHPEIYLIKNTGIVINKKAKTKTSNKQEYARYYHERTIKNRKDGLK
jgi:hypothetical protein